MALTSEFALGARYIDDDLGNSRPSRWPFVLTATWLNRMSRRRVAATVAASLAFAPGCG